MLVVLIHFHCLVNRIFLIIVLYFLLIFHFPFQLSYHFVIQMRTYPSLGLLAS